jgi:SAM-dependent methyltransferase
MRALAHESLAAGDATGWFESLYAEADGEAGAISWADLAPNPALVSWLERWTVPEGARVLVPGGGLGDDAALLAASGARVTAFDVSPTAVDWARRRHPEVGARWHVADVLDLPRAWHRAFDLVAEVYTLQCLPAAARPVAIDALAATVAPGGRLVAVGRLRDDDDEPDGPPWPLAARELRRFEDRGLVEVELVDRMDDEDPPVRRFAATYADAARSASAR